jgi:prepilin-type N-terminal cleavage/methylation domain-containing protein
MKNLRNSKGFTLIELLVVIAIIGILASFVFVSVANARKKARDGQIKNAFGQIKTQAAMIIDDTNSYEGMMEDETIEKLLQEARDAGSADVNGTAAGESYIYYAQLVSDTNKYFCVDSEGHSNVVDSVPAGDTCS